VGAGEGLYYTVPYTLTDGTETAFVVNDFSNRGFVGIQGKTVPLLPIDTTLGGISEAYDINENNQVVGYGTTALESASLQTAVDNCSDEDLRADVPFESCIKTLIDSYSANLVATSQTRGMIWQLDNDGEVLASTELGILLTPDADDTTIYASRAVAINDNGIAVGTSSAEYEISNVIINRSFATIFDGEQLINLTPEADETALRTLSSPLVSSAVDINNDNLVVGYQLKSVNGNVRTKFFVYDMDVGELIFPADFFLGSSSAPLSVNNNGLVVGYGEVDASRSARRNSGFLYDHNNQTFTDINTLLACDSPYTILQGNGINDNNEIIATARVETEIRDAKGQILLGDDGNTIIREAVIAVKLEPIPGGQVDSCELPANSQTRDRQGASMSWLLLLAGFAFGAGRIRRWTKS
jgi:hypothetical protein